MPLNIPMLLTWLRIILIPLLVAVYYVPEGWIGWIGRDTAAMIIFVSAGVTDWLDGYLARRWNETSAFGAFLDPVADKLVVATALILLVQFDRVDTIIAVIIIGREITISSLREWMAQIGATGGKSRSAAKREAARANGRLGGRPGKKEQPVEV